jgi:hypothetical protein
MPTGDGNAYRLKGLFFTSPAFEIDRQGASHHRRLEIALTYKEVLDEMRRRVADLS